jgi:hypothetical protein
MAGFGTRKQEKQKLLNSVKQFLKEDRRFKNKTPTEFARFCRETDVAQARKDFVSRPVTEESLFNPASDFHYRQLHLQNDDGVGFEMAKGYWVVRVANYQHAIKSKVPDWEIELLVDDSRIVFPAVIRERIIKHLGEDIYIKWKTEVLSTEHILKEVLNRACKHMREPMAASWITSPSSERLLKRMGIPMEREWAFLFQGMTFE